MEDPRAIRPGGIENDGIDFQKLNSVIFRNIYWMIFIFLSCNLAAYLTIRWTKDLFESVSELKLDVKSDASELGIKNFVEDQNADRLSGEIEQIKSRLFLGKVIDSLDIWVSYFSEGNILRDEMYLHAPFKVTYDKFDPEFMDKPIHVDLIDGSAYQLKIQDKLKLNGQWGKPLEISKGTFITISRDDSYTEDDNNVYFFIVNSRAKLIDYLSKNISVDPLNFNANTIRISFRDFNVQKARDIVNKIDSVYIAYSNYQKNLANKQKIDWLNKELVQVEAKMEDFENYFENFTLVNKSSNLEDDLKRTITAINKVDSQRFDISKKITELNGAMDDLMGSNYLTGIQAYSFLPATITTKIENLQKILSDRDKIGLAYNESTYAFRQKDKDVTLLRDQIIKNLTDLKKEWLKKAAELNQRKEKLEKEFSSMPDKNTQFAKNQRYYKLYEEFYLSMMQSKAQFEIAQAGSTPDFKILSSATQPANPISPKKYLIYGIGATAGIVLNFFFIGLLYLVNNKIIGTQEIERNTNIPILGIIPESRSMNSHSIFHILENPKSIVSESIRILRTNLDFFTAGDGKKVITISSTISGEGKSFLAANLGGVVAMSNKKVILVDVDMRKMKYDKHSPGHFDPAKGVSTILIKKNNWQECVQKTTIEHLDFIPSGPIPPNPSELLINGEFYKLLDELKLHYDLIVVDTPPAGLVTDGIISMKVSDLSIYVIRAAYTKSEYLDTLKRIQLVNKLNNIAIAFNGLNYTGKSYGYGYGYYQESVPIKKGWRKFFKS